MGKQKQNQIDAEYFTFSKMEKDYRPFQPPTRLDDAQVLGSQLNPSIGLLEGREWVPSAQTDVTRTWRKFGWRPIAEIEAEKGIDK